MEESYSRKDFWNGAGKAGLVLGLVPVVYMLVEQLLLQDAADTLGNLPATLVTFALWLAKFAGCIFLMRWFLQRFAAAHPGVSRRDVYRYGTAIALTSALVYSAFVLAWSKFIDPEMFSRAFEEAASRYSSMMDSNTTEMMESLADKMPVIAFFSNLIYCFLYGTVLSAILAGNVAPDKDPFADGSNPFTNDKQ